jgi:hypothetical protein
MPNGSGDAGRAGNKLFTNSGPRAAGQVRGLDLGANAVSQPMVPVMTVTVPAVAKMRRAGSWPVPVPSPMVPPGMGTPMVRPGTGGLP